MSKYTSYDIACGILGEYDNDELDTQDVLDRFTRHFVEQACAVGRELNRPDSVNNIASKVIYEMAISDYQQALRDKFKEGE